MTAPTAMDTLRLLISLGFICEVFCGSGLPGCGEVPVLRRVADVGAIAENRPSSIGDHRADLIYVLHRDVPITIVPPRSVRGDADADGNLVALVAFFDKKLDVFGPDFIVTISGDWVSQLLVRRAKRRDIPVVFLLNKRARCYPMIFHHAD